MGVRQGLRSFYVSVLASLAVVAPAAQASIGYEPDATTPQIPLDVDFTHGVAIDQSNQRIYVGGSLKAASPSPPYTGEIIQLESNGTATANSPFTAGPNAFFSGVAVNPVTHDLYASRNRGDTPFGSFGEGRMHLFSSTGTALSSFALANNDATAPQIAADSSGRVYYPNPVTASVEVFDAAGALQSTIVCSGCPGGTFSQPAGVAIDSSNNVYVVDIGRDYVVKLKPAAQSFAFERQFQSGGAAAAVAVNSTTGDVFVGALPTTNGYHIVAYSSGGTQFDDFAATKTTPPPSQGGKWLAPQLAVNETTNDLYVSDQKRLLVFERTTIAPPTATIGSASLVTQLKATLNASVNAKGHAVVDCEFQYVDHAEFLIDGFTGALSTPCLTKPAEAVSRPVSQNLTGLTPGTQYHFRVVAETNAGSVTSSGQTFSTLAANPPVITAQPATGVSQTGATLAAKVNPKGGTVSACHFEYGTSAAYGSQVPCTSLPGELSSDVALTRGVTGLTAGTTYHFRLVVTNNAGTTKGADGQFTTSAASSQPSPPSGGSSPGLSPLPPPIATPTPTPTRKPLRCKKGFVKKKVRGKMRCVKKKPRKRAARKRSRSR